MKRTSKTPTFGSGIQGHRICATVAQADVRDTRCLTCLARSRFVSISPSMLSSCLSSKRARRRTRPRLPAPSLLRTRLSSSPKATSKPQCSWFSIRQCWRVAASNRSASGGRLPVTYRFSVAVSPFAAPFSVSLPGSGPASNCSGSIKTTELTSAYRPLSIRPRPPTSIAQQRRVSTRSCPSSTSV